jgi:hypothetical protein
MTVDDLDFEAPYKLTLKQLQRTSAAPASSAASPPAAPTVTAAKGASDDDEDEESDEEVDIQSALASKAQADASKRVDDRKNALKEKDEYEKAKSAAAQQDDDRAELISAICVSFDTHFDAMGGCKDCPVEFRTDPASPYTHWKQTVLHLPRPLLMKQGDVLVGKLRIRRNHTNPRELDVRLEGKVNAVDQAFSQHYHMD